MAKRKAGEPNKSQVIRDYVDAHPRLKPQPLAEKIKEETGIELTPGFVSTIKSQYKKKKRGGGKKRGRKPGTARAASAGGSVSFELLKSAKELSAKLGGIDKARKILDALAELSQ